MGDRYEPPVAVGVSEIPRQAARANHDRAQKKILGSVNKEGPCIIFLGVLKMFRTLWNGVPISAPQYSRFILNWLLESGVVVVNIDAREEVMLHLSVIDLVV